MAWVHGMITAGALAGMLASIWFTRCVNISVEERGRIHGSIGHWVSDTPLWRHALAVFFGRPRAHLYPDLIAQDAREAGIP